jgi:hypothetical protein
MLFVNVPSAPFAPETPEKRSEECAGSSAQSRDNIHYNVASCVESLFG